MTKINKKIEKDLTRYGLEFLSPRFRPNTILLYSNKTSSETIKTVNKRGLKKWNN